MKIKRFNNLWSMGLILSAVIILAIYICKIFFPEFVVEVAQVESITAIGHFIDKNKWSWYIVSIILSFFVYYFYCCACCKKKSLPWKEVLYIVGMIAIVYLTREFFPNQYTSVNISSMILLPLLMNGDFKATCVSFIATNFVQTITLEIRGLALLISNFNYATLLILCFDSYIIIGLLYCFYNYKERNKE